MSREEELQQAADEWAEFYKHAEDVCDYISVRIAFKEGAKWADEHPYWRPATEHPVADLEVIALVGKHLEVVFAHIVKDRERVVDYDGWNIPEVKWWMPIQSIGEPEENEW